MANGLETFLSKIGKKAEVVFEWLGSPKGQAVVTGTETAAVVVAGAFGGPALGAAVQGIEGLVNAGLKNAITVENVAASASQQSGTGAQKSAAVVNALTSNAGAFLKSIGVNDATDAEVQSLATVIGTASADILNAIPARAVTAS
jgi:hypothetical protein